MRNELNLEKKESSGFKKFNNRMLIINLGLVVLFFSSQILVTSILGTKTQEIDLVRNQKEELRLQNEIITSEIDKAKSVAASEQMKDKYNLVEKTVTFLNAGDNNDLALQ